MSAPARTLLADVESWAIALLAPPPPALIPVVTEPAPTTGTVGIGDLHLLYGGPVQPGLETVRVGRVTHLVPTWSARARCGRDVTGPWSPAVGAPVSCPGCALPPEAD